MSRQDYYFSDLLAVHLGTKEPPVMLKNGLIIYPKRKVQDTDGSRPNRMHIYFAQPKGPKGIKRLKMFSMDFENAEICKIWMDLLNHVLSESI